MKRTVIKREIRIVTITEEERRRYNVPACLPSGSVDMLDRILKNIFASEISTATHENVSAPIVLYFGA